MILFYLDQGIKKKVVLHLRSGNSVGLERIGNSIMVNYKNKKLRFYFDSQAQFNSTLFFIREQFVEEQYNFLRPANKVVVDIGGNVGDTSLYFLSNGAKKVYAFEPNPYFYDLAKKNLRSSTKSKDIVFTNAGGSGKKTKVAASSMLGELVSLKEKYSKSKDVELLTLEDIIKRSKVKKAVMKIDCEGCEYDLILNSKPETLKKFDRIAIAHHFNYDEMRES